ncbi:hypothetical protein D9758_006308 [Tetrapyrgos nigripes]|uniref:DUF7330 domain-containing protein n=1 Tax=Tetrapyrgos nigripes TaxID=182062 RepID=A0A8H5G028_9AGAR|nr:hypothetical protein D9758_006308 [Tetrapyrgos nigripes]
MIIADDTPQSPVKSPNPTHPHPPSLSQDPPPSYGAAQTSQTPLMQSNAGPSHPYTITSAPQGESPARRFFKAFAVALLIWVLFGVFVGTSINVRTSRHAVFQERESYDIPKDLHLDSCVNGPDMHSSSIFSPQTVSESFKLPLSSKNLFIISRGASYGLGGPRTFSIVPSSDISEDVVRVDVKIMYLHEDMLARTKVCRVRRRGGENGVGFFTLPLHPRNAEDWFYVDIVLNVPEVGYDPVKIQSFETDLPQFQHSNLGSLSDFVEFDKLSLSSSNAKIDAKSLIASNAHVETSSGSITGTYDAVGDLSLKTSNGKIEVTVNLTSSSNKGVLAMKNSNGRIEADVNLLSGSGKAQDDHFTASSITSNGEIILNVLSLPYESSLNLEAKTSNQDATVKVPQTFEGHYTLSTSNAAPALHRDERSENDPAGEGRARQVVSKSRMKSWMQGNVYWEKEHENRSDVRVRSSNARVTLWI